MRLGLRTENPTVDDALTREALGALESQLHDTLYGGNEHSAFCNDSAWRELEPETQDKLWSAGLVQKLSLAAQMQAIRRTGIGPWGQRASQDYVDSLQEDINNWGKRLLSVRTRLGKVGLTDTEE